MMPGLPPLNMSAKSGADGNMGGTLGGSGSFGGNTFAISTGKGTAAAAGGKEKSNVITYAGLALAALWIIRH